MRRWYAIRYHREDHMAITATEARRNLFPLIEQVNNDRTRSRSCLAVGTPFSSRGTTTRPSSRLPT